MSGERTDRVRLGWFRTCDGRSQPIGWFGYWRGRWRLRSGYCPLCNSSPPRPLCPVCQGSYRYSYELPDQTRARWRKRFDAMRKEARRVR